MSKQAKKLTQQELRRALDYVATRRHAARNRAMLMAMYLEGLRVGECAPEFDSSRHKQLIYIPPA
jgi:integrase/recombinase XerD